MTTAYNPMFTHRLEPISGFDEITHLQFTAPMTSDALTQDNGSGEEPGLPAGSVVALNSSGVFKAGAKGTEMPMFLLWNTSDPDGFPSATTANGQYIAGIAGTSAGQSGNLRLDSAELIRNLYTTSTGTINSNTVNYVDADTGGANSLYGRATSSSGNVISYTLRNCVGNFTAWPATCGLELNSTEWDKSIESSSWATSFAPNTLLTAPEATASSSINTTTYPVGTEKYYQQKRGGFLRPVVVADYTTSTAVTTAAGPEFLNVCGTVSKGIHRNENGVNVLYYWAERTLIPKTYVAPAGGGGGGGTV